MSNKQDTRFPLANKFFNAIIQTMAIIEMDLRKLKHDPFELLTRTIQPVIWLMIFGQAMANVKAIPTGASSYLDFIAPGILAQSVLFISIFFGISLIWEKDMGILHKTLVAPVPRVCLVIGRAISAGLRSFFQVFVIYMIALLINVNLRFEFFPFLGILSMVMLGSAIFATLSLIVASIVKKRERFMGIGQVLTMPLFFASNALYPIHLMPSWIQMLSVINPLTYQVDALRDLMIVGEKSYFGLLTDFSVSILIFAVLTYVATKAYAKILY